MSYDFDLFVLGAGSGGVAASRRAASYGAKVGLAESGALGGTCVNKGCVPKKLLVYASHFSSVPEEALGYGWKFEKGQFNWKPMIEGVRKEVSRLNGIYTSMLRKAKVEVFATHATLADPHTIQLGNKKVRAEKILIAVGGKPSKPDLPGFDQAMISDAIFELNEQPEDVIIIGGGYIGCEFACVFNGLGTKVKQVIRGDNILKGFDHEIQTAVQAAMQKNGIELITGAEIRGLARTSAGYELQLADQNIKASKVCLAATGRIPNTNNLGLESCGIQMERGAIKVNEESRTNIDHIFAVGDCTNRINLTPVAINEGRAFADTEFGKVPRLMSHENVPSAIFTTPEAATVGMTEEEACKTFGEENISIYRSQFRPMYYTLSDLPERTLTKLVVHKNTQKILGAHMVGDNAAEIIQGVAIAVKMGARKSDFDATVGIHPSSAEEFVTMAKPV